MLDELTTSTEATVGLGNALGPIGASLLAAIAAYLMYQWFYGSKHIGAGVHRTFLIGGPAITLIFVVIQTSVPLGIGLLGALSFVRFRTPIKDPAEIGFLLLLIAAAIGTSTENYLATVVLFVIVFITLQAQELLKKRGAMFGIGHLMISLEQSAFSKLEKGLSDFLKDRLSGLRMETMSTMDNRVSLHYKYRKNENFDWATFNDELDRLTGSSKVEIFIS